MKPEYVDASDLIQPDNRSDAQKWLDAEMDKRWANEQGAEPYPILEAIALEVIEENQRLRAHIGQAEPDWDVLQIDAAVTQAQKVLSDWNEWYGTHGKNAQLPPGGIVKAQELLAVAKSLLASAPPAPQRKPLLDEKKIEMWTNATIECCTHMACYMRGIEDAEAAHNIGEKK